MARLLLLLLSAGLGASGAVLFAAAAPSALHNGNCGMPKPIENAQIMEGSGSTSTKLRYSCAKNYKREAGTSSLIVCKQDENTKEFRWTEAQLRCIRDPSLPIPQPETTTEDSRRGSLPLGIGLPLLVLAFIVVAVWKLCRRRGCFLRQMEVPHEEEMASLRSEGGGGGGSQNIPTASDLINTGAGNEGAAILSAHGASSAS